MIEALKRKYKGFLIQLSHMNNLNEEIKKRIDIIEFIGSRMTLKKTGRNFKGNCPFHQEKTPSFVVSPERQIWHCFGSCGDGGDVIKFLMKWDNITYLEAIKEFAEKLGLPLKEYSLQDTNVKLRERLFSANRHAANFYSYMLSKSRFGDKAREYLEKRGIHREIVHTFELGYAPSSWDSLLRYMESKKFTLKELIDAGLVLRNEKGSVYDRFRGRLMFPLKDARENIVGFSGRSLNPDEKTAKYVNTPETLVYHKRETLFGIHLAKGAIKKERCIILVEGEFDMITPYQYGIEHIAAIKGSTVTHDQLMLIKRYANRVYLALDADAAGEEAIKRGIEEAERLEFELGVIVFDFAKDPDEAVRADPVKFKEAVHSPVPVYDYIIDFYRKKFPGNDVFSKKNMGEAVVPFFTHINNPIVASHYVKKLAALLEVSEESVRLLLRKKNFTKTSTAAHFTKAPISPANREDMVQKYFLGSLLQYEAKKTLLDKLVSLLSPEDFSFPAYQKLYRLVQEKREIFERSDINTFASLLPPELKAIFDELYLYASADIAISEHNIGRLAYEIKERALKRGIRTGLDQESGKMDEDALSRLNKELKELEKRAISV
jgi:DNA primase